MASTVSFKSLVSVQELAKEQAMGGAIPQHYVVCPDQQPLICSDDGANFLSLIPAIDMKCLVTSETSELELEKLHSTCKDWGVFQLVNHGVSSSLIEKVKYEIEEFFKLPFEEKMKYQRRPDDIEGYGKNLLISDDQKLDWGDQIYMITNPINSRKPHLLPQFPPSLRDTLESYFSELQKLAMKIFGLMAKALKIDMKEMEDMFEDGREAVRMSYYPPCPTPDLVIGLRPHLDASGITILHQVNGVDGLQVKKDGAWFPLNFLPDALVVNVGNTLEIFSNGAYKSIEHRVTVNSIKERISMAMVVNPNFEAVVGPAKSLINPNNPPLYKTVGMQKYLKYFYLHKFDGKAHLEEMKINNCDHCNST